MIGRWVAITTIAASIILLTASPATTFTLGDAGNFTPTVRLDTSQVTLRSP